MATLKYLSCTLSFIVLFCFHVIEVHALGVNKEVDENLHYHRVEINSLLPALVCDQPPTGDKGPSKRQSTLEVFHRHGPCSKAVPYKTIATPSFSEVLIHDQSRVNSIQARLASKSNTDEISDKKVNIPAQDGQSLGSGGYLVKVGLGTPTKYLSLIFDTGSDLTWTQCQPCAKSCHQQQDSIFNPSASTSYANISCTSNLCSQLTSATGNRPSCTASTCVYGIQYGDQSFSVGFFSSEKLTISATDVIPNFLFGCGQNNQGLFGSTDGLLGLGRDPLSIVSQTAQKYGKYFSYCLPSTSSSAGYLALGKSGASTNAKFTPFASSQGTSFYFLDILAISIGGRQLPISQSVFSTAGTIIDSGTTITRLPSTAYSTMSSAFQKLMTKYPRAPAYSILDTCYDFTKYTTVTIPTVSFIFGGNVKVDLDPSGILVAVTGTQACLAFAGNTDATDVSIFGNTQQKTLQVVYDLAGGKLGFGSYSPIELQILDRYIKFVYCSDGLNLLKLNWREGLASCKGTEVPHVDNQLG